MFSKLLLFAMNILPVLFQCQWENCNQNQKCIFGLNNKSIVIKGRKITFHCNSQSPDVTLFQCADAIHIKTNLTLLVLSNCKYHNFNMENFLGKLKLPVIQIRQTLNFTSPFQLIISNMPFIEAIRITGIQSTGLFNLTLLSLMKLHSYISNGNIFTTIPETPFRHLPAITYLSMSNGTLINLPEGIFYGLHSLEKLFLDSNQIVEIKSLTFNSLYNLKYLDLHGNNIKILNANVFLHLRGLHSLLLHNNNLLNIPLNLFNYVPNLELLKINQNSRIKHFPKRFFKGAWKLQEIDVSKCSLERIEGNIFFDTIYTQRKEILSGSVNLKQNHRNEIKYLNIFFKMLHTKALINLSFKNKIQHLIKMGTPFKNLKFVYLSYNKLIAIEIYTFELLVNLEVVDLSHNPIHVLPDFNPFGPSKSLEIIKLSGCHISQILNSWMFPRSLRLLALDNNKFNDFPSSFTVMVNSSPNIKLYLAGNPWRCHCKDLSFFYWINRQTEKILDYNDLRCYTDFSSVTSDVKSLHQNNSLKLACSTRRNKKLRDERQRLIVFLSTISISMIVLFCFVFVYQERMLIGALMYKHIFSPRKKIRLYQHKLYHAFLCYCRTDRQVMRKLVRKLEPSHSICIHGRTTLPVRGKIQMIMYSIVHSNITLLILSKQFLESSWFQVQFRTAHHRIAQKQKVRVCSIFVEDIKRSSFLPDVRRMLRQRTSLRWGERYFWEKLNYILYINAKK